MNSLFTFALVSFSTEKDVPGLPFAFTEDWGVVVGWNWALLPIVKSLLSSAQERWVYLMYFPGKKKLYIREMGFYLLQLKELVSVREQSAKLNRNMLKLTSMALIILIDWQPGNDKKFLRVGVKFWSKAGSFSRYTAVRDTTFKIVEEKRCA